MGSVARQPGAYGGEYLRAELRLCARGGRKEAKKLVKLGQIGGTRNDGAAEQNSILDQPGAIWSLSLL
jgi:hypothetical protein